MENKALAGAIVAGVTGFLAWLANVPPEQQDALLAPLVAVMPVDWRPSIGLITRALSTIATIYVAYQSTRRKPAETGTKTSVVPLVILLVAASALTGCAGYAVGFGGSYTARTGEQYGGSVNLVPTKGYAK